MAKNNSPKNTKPGKEAKKPESNVNKPAKKDNRIQVTPPAEMFPQEEPVETISSTAETASEVETPADAPMAPASNEGPVVSEETREADTENTAPAPVNKIIPTAPSREEGEKTGEQPVAETDAAPEAVAAPIEEYIGFGSRHSDEQKLERYLIKRNNTTKLTHIQLGQSGINMNKVGLVVGRVGKFKLKREFPNADWKITIE